MRNPLTSCRVLFFFAVLSLTFLPGASCTNNVNSHVSGGSTDGSGPSSGITVVPGMGANNWSYGSAAPTTQESGMLGDINAYRNGLGLPTLIWHDGISEVAQLHNKDMVNRGFFSIVNPDGVDPYQRMVSSSPRIDFDNAFAFVAQCNGGAASAMPLFNALIDNTASRTVIESPKLTHFGGESNNQYDHGTYIFAVNARP